MTPETNAKEYVDQSRRSGMSDDEIRRSLNEAGWDEASIASAMAQPVSLGNPERNWAAVTALALGISGLLIGFFGSIPAIIFGILGLSSKKRGMAIAGIVLGGIVTVIYGSLMLLTVWGLGDARDLSSDARIKSSIQQMRVVAEIIHSDENSYITATCDHSDMAFLCSDVAEHGSGDVTIVTLPDAWCASAPLYRLDNFCVDSVGERGSGGCSSAGICE